jgi:hypothetical protein
MSIFNPQLETQIQPEQAIRAPEQYSPLAAIAEAGSKFLRATAKEAPSATSIKQANTAAVSRALDEAAQLKEQGKPFKTAAQRAVMTYLNSGAGDLPDDLKTVYQGVVGEPFEAIGYQDEAEYEQAQVLNSETGIALATSVRASNPNLAPEEVDELVFQQLNEIALNNQSVALQQSRVAAGKPIEATPIVQAIQSDFQLLAGQVELIRSDGIITKGEYDNAVAQTRALIASKYAAFGENKQVKAVQDQMFGLLTDVGKGVSQDQLDVQLDAVQVALQKANLNPATIATVRALVKTNPEKFSEILNTQLGEQGESFVDALDSIWDAPTPEMELNNFFGIDTRPDTTGNAGGDNPSLMNIPSVSQDPAAYEAVVANFSDVTGSANPTTIIQSETTRNSWLKTMNVTASAVASQSDEYILGEKLLSKFASNGVVNNLDAVYRTDPLNAAQTNDALQQALAAERIRNDNELNQRLNSGDAAYFRMSESGELVLNSETMRSKIMQAYEGGNTSIRDRRLADQKLFEEDVAAVGGLEKLMALPEARRNEILQGSPIPNLIDERFSSTLKLVKNMKLIDTKLGSLTALESKYDSATTMFRGAQESGDTTTTPTAAPENITYRLPADVQEDGAFLNEVNRVAEDIGLTADALLAVMDFETAGSFAPDQRALNKDGKPISSATGLIQFLERTAKSLGTSTKALSSMSRVEQMEYVEKYLAPYKDRINNVGDLYMAVHWPRGIGKDDNYVMYRKDSDDGEQRKAYKANSSLDVDNNGTVTRGETLARLRSVTGNKYQITETELPPAGAMDTDELVSVAEQAIQGSVRPQARVELPTVATQDFFNDSIKSKIESTGLDPNTTLFFATQADAEEALQQGRIKSGDRVVIGTSVVEVE